MFDGSIVQGGWLGNTAKDHGGTGLLLVLSILLVLNIYWFKHFIGLSILLVLICNQLIFS
ncbi:hypothetical protein DU86_17440 [Methanosarcina mazei]|uniref:Uncharacterized protein n=1 Tax=Methanosarcina mazei TaxID=2209 RepID=A0A0F8GL08_METMZ|nr:hypothetical protein DU40_11985 [Methanosarcina mazei]KKG04012.1 hypothetical protein DU31_17755 [Methanosarcina mazei]KKG07251.1 hypothetical protein DU34_19450 [Methanosarcina mazei]KKG57921.1 hypothetical protein DU33_13325 [Methanosarcina mazei]KKG63949.1 hypothetical protein DU64_08220 [Methanosarcina mazei]